MAGWSEAEQDEEVMRWVQGFHDAMASHATGGVYVNVLGTNEEARVRAAYGSNYNRLVELKKKWDPDNLFRRNHNIPPTG
ncbi:MAG: BBE domain-containing protein [Acidobacteriota bacterium]